MAYDVERVKAKQLAVEEGKSMDEICAAFPHVSPATIYRWKAEDQWDKEREEISMTSFHAMKQMLAAATTGLEEVAKDLKAHGMSGFDSQKSFALLRFLKDVKSMQKDIDNYGNIILTMQEFTSFLSERDPDALRNIQHLLIEFGSVMSKRYGKK